MSLVSIDDAKSHLNVTHDDDDALISGLVDAAEAHLQQSLGYKIEDRFLELPADLRLAIMQLVANYYEVREASYAEALLDVPFTVEDIITSRRDWLF